MFHFKEDDSLICAAINILMSDMLRPAERHGNRKTLRQTPSCSTGVKRDITVRVGTLWKQLPVTHQACHEACMAAGGPKHLCAASRHTDTNQHPLPVGDLSA